MRIDLHTHSSVSDGTQRPAELVRAAAAAGLDVVAITDHDTTEGWAEAAEAAATERITLVRGIEISTRYRGRSVHLLGYLPDPSHPGLQAALRRILDGRNARVPAILERLVEVGVELDPEEVRRQAGGAAATGRPHVADALVARGVVADREEAFDRLLSPGRPGYVERSAEPLVETVRLVGAAGGVAVVAHPWGRQGRRGLDREDLAALAGEGLAGIEVDHQDHAPAERRELRGIAADLGLVATGSSDHHGAGKRGHELGCNTTDPEAYARLVELAGRAAAEAGRDTPRVLTG